MKQVTSLKRCGLPPSAIGGLVALLLLVLLLASCDAAPMGASPRPPAYAGGGETPVSTGARPPAYAEGEGSPRPQGEGEHSPRVFTPAPERHRVPAHVVKVFDGDTILVSIDGLEYVLRYIGIDTPETVRPGHPVEWLGPEATAVNKALVNGQDVYLEKDVSETDRYGRLLRYVYLEDGTMVNAELVRMGYAYSRAYPPDVKHQELLDLAERGAREAGRGLWASP